MKSLARFSYAAMATALLLIALGVAGRWVLQAESVLDLNWVAKVKPPMSVELMKLSCKSAAAKQPFVLRHKEEWELTYDLHEPCSPKSVPSKAPKQLLSVHNEVFHLEFLTSQHNDVVNCRITHSLGSAELDHRVLRDVLDPRNGPLCRDCRVTVTVIF